MSERQQIDLGVWKIFTEDGSEVELKVTKDGIEIFVDAPKIGRIKFPWEELDAAREALNASLPKPKTQMQLNLEQAGWGDSPASSKWHYFEANNTDSLCGRIGFFFGPREQGNDNSPDNCAACKKKLQKLLADLENA